LPVPPRSVIIERLPDAPPRPRDIIIERWIPYGAAAKRKTVVQRAAAAQAYAAPRNVIIQYEAVQVKIVRQFERLGVTQENPQAYVQRYGVALLDAQTLLQQARAAGVVEDISPPAGAAASFSASSSSSFSSGAEFAGASGAEFGVGGVVAGGAGFESGLAEGAGGSFNASSYESYSAGGAGGAGGAGFGAEASFGGAGGAGGFGGASSYESSSYSSGGGAGGFDVAAAAFRSADANRDGAVDQTEFKQFFQGGL